MAYSFMNAVTVANSFGEIKIDKQPGKKNSRIDPVDAAIDAHFISVRGGIKRLDSQSLLQKYLEILKK